MHVCVYKSSVSADVVYVMYMLLYVTCMYVLMFDKLTHIIGNLLSLCKLQLSLY